MQRWHYRYAGLRVASDVELPEWRVFESAHPFDDPDVWIRLDRAPFADKLPNITPELFHFHVEEVGEYCVRAGREIAITAQLNAGWPEIRLYLLGSAWGALCYQRGILVLHASVVQLNDHAVAFCGTSGAGKSSLVAWLTARGYRLVGDDLCHFELTGESPSVYPASPRLKLWRDALANLGWPNDGLTRDHFRMDKFHVSDPGPRFSEGNARERAIDWSASLPLRAIYLLEWGEPSVERLTGIAALRQLVATATYHGELLEPMSQVAAHWERCARLAQRVPIFRFARPSDWTRMDAAMAMLMDRWHEAF